MHGIIGLAPAAGDAHFGARVAAALDWPRVTTVALVTVLLSLGALLSRSLLDFFSPVEIAGAWLAHLLELGVIAAALLAAYAVLDAALPRGMRLRLAVTCAALLALSALLAVLLHAYYAEGFTHLPPPLRMLADSLRWGLPAVFLTLIADVHRRALQADSAAHAAELAGAQLEQGESEQRLALLQAQIEPHFLFNMLGNVRRLYRTRPQAGAEAIGNLMRYLRTALPQLRSRRTSLDEELASVRAYLELFQLRMGAQLDFSIEADPALHDAEFPPMLLVTLVENAIKHGLEPAGGGRIDVRASRRGDLLEVAVLDDGAGFGATATSGTGVGLANVQRQLAARYRHRGRLGLEAREPRGARATITIPLRNVTDANRVVADPARAAGAHASAVAASFAASAERPARPAGFLPWMRAHRGAVVMAGLLAFAAPVTFFTGALSVMRAPGAGSIARLGVWWALYGASLWILLLGSGYWLERKHGVGRAMRVGLWMLAAGLAAAATILLTSGRTTVLIEQGLVHSAWTAHLHAFTVSLVMALLFFAHLHRSRWREESAARLAAAQAEQRRARRRMVQSRLQEVQSRIDPQLLFDLLDDARRCYERDPMRAERFLDELIAFLRAALPRLRTASSSLLREVELAQAFASLHAFARDDACGMVVEVAPDAMHARFPPGVLLPLLDGAAGSATGPCRLTAARSNDGSRLRLTLDVVPTDAAAERVRRLLDELHGAAGALAVETATATEATGPGATRAVSTIVTVPYELA